MKKIFTLIAAACSSSPKWTQKMIINYLYF